MVTVRIPPTRFTWPVSVTSSFAHWNGRPGGGCSHGPCSMDWPPLKLIAWLPCRLRLDPSSPSSGWRLWLYTRFGAWYGDLFIHRRVDSK
jgi:hypothetical protein